MPLTEDQKQLIARQLIAKRIERKNVRQSVAVPFRLRNSGWRRIDVRRSVVVPLWRLNVRPPNNYAAAANRQVLLHLI